MSVPLLIADGMIATTRIAERVLRDAWGAVETCTAEQLVGRELSGRPLFISRLCHPRYRWLPAYLTERRLLYVYLLDDHFHALTPEHDRVHGSFFSHPAVHHSLDTFLRCAAQVWLMSSLLERELRDRLPGLCTCYIEAPVDLALFDRHRSQEPEPQSRVFKVGYASSRRPNVAALLTEVVTQAELRWRDSVRFEFIGWCPEAIAERANVKVLPAVEDYEAYVRLKMSRGWQAGLAPMGDSLFENCKTSLKFREYAAARVPGIYSRVALFEDAVSDGVNGLLVDPQPAAWLNAIDRLRQDAGLHQRILMQARRDVEARHAQAVVAAKVLTAFAPIWG